MSEHADNQADAATDMLLGGLRILELSDELG
jgi:hypothetical protein